MCARTPASRRRLALLGSALGVALQLLVRSRAHALEPLLENHLRRPRAQPPASQPLLALVHRPIIRGDQPSERRAARARRGHGRRRDGALGGRRVDTARTRAGRRFVGSSRLCVNSRALRVAGGQLLVLRLVALQQLCERAEREGRGTRRAREISGQSLDWGGFEFVRSRSTSDRMSVCFMSLASDGSA